MTRVIAVASGKGGVGKTTTSINLATALTHLGFETVLVDGNLTTPNIGVHLGSASVPTNLHDVLKGRASISQAAYQHSSGVKVIPGNIAVEDYDRINPERLSEAVLDLEGRTDIVLIDTPAGIEQNTVEALKAADEVLVVTTPDILSTTNALKTIKLAKELGKRVSVVINRSGQAHSMSTKEVEALMGRSTIGSVPEDEAVKKALFLRQPVVHSHPYSPAGQEFKRIAASIVDRKYTREKEGFLDSLLRRLGLKL